MGAAGTPADADFDDWWFEWVRLEGAGYKQVEGEEDKGIIVFALVVLDSNNSTSIICPTGIQAVIR